MNQSPTFTFPAMKKRNSHQVGIVALLAAIGYVIIPYDMDIIWYGYSDDFFTFMSGYTFYYGEKSKSRRSGLLLTLISGCFFIVGMIALIILILAH